MVKEYKILMRGGELKTVSGRRCKIVPWMDTFSRYEDGSYVVSECSSGAYLSLGKTLNVAVSTAKMLIEKHKKWRVVRYINVIKHTNGL